MVGDILAFFFLLVIPVILWAVPRTRRMTGNWIVALKSVPVGCATATFVILLLVGLAGMTLNGRALLAIGVALVAAIVAIVGCARFIRWKYRAENKRAILPFVVLFLLFACIPGICSIAYSGIRLVIALHSGEHYVGDWRSFELPPEQGVELAFEERSIHPFQAEYEYRLRFGKADEAVYRYLRVNTGGRTAFNLYRLKDGRLLLRDKDGNYLADAAARQLLVLFEYNGKRYGAACPDRVFHDWGWATQEGETVFYEFDGQRVEAQLLPPELFDGWSFYGSISNKFLPAGKGEIVLQKKPPARTAFPAGETSSAGD